MKTVGRRKEREITFHATSENLKEGARMNDIEAKLSMSNGVVFPKGVYHYRTHEEANTHWEECLISNIVNQNRKRKTYGTNSEGSNT